MGNKMVSDFAHMLGVELFKVCNFSGVQALLASASCL